MGRINAGRVVLGGLLAGLVINIGEFILNVPVIGEEYEAAVTALGLTPPGGAAIALYVVCAFLVGIAAVWLYAAMRPRFGAGPRTAALAGLTVFGLAWLYPLITFATMGAIPTGLLVIGGVWGLVEVPLATVVGAWAYREEAGAAAPTPASADRVAAGY